MLRHTLLLIYRHFRHFKSTFLINLVGLSTGMACVILIYLWANDELGFDRFHEKTDRLYQVMDNEMIDGAIKTTGHTYDFLANALKEEMPEVEYAAVTTPRDFFPGVTLNAGGDYTKGVVKFAEEDFFNMFSFGLSQGNANQVLTKENGVVISESLSKKLFGTTQDIVGKTIGWQLMTLSQSVEVTGVFSDVPANASEHFDFVLPFNSFRKIMGGMTGRNWNNISPFHTYIVVKENADVNALQLKVAGLLQTKAGKGFPHSLFLEPYGDIYLHGRFENGVSVGGRIEYVRLFSIIACIILLIACVNFINLFTARATRRVREVGIRKAIGAPRLALIKQYLAESMLMSVIALVIALGLVQLVLPQFGDVTGKHLLLKFDAISVITICAIAIVTGLLAGTYPALYISGFQPAKILRGQLTSSPGETWARKGLVVFQFTLSVISIVSVLILNRQVEYVQSLNVGFDKDNILFFESEGKVAQAPSAFLAELKNIPGVVDASSMLANIVGEGSGMPGGGTAGKVTWNGKDIIMSSVAVNYDLIETLGIRMKSGRTFSKDFPADRDKIIYNQAAVDALGITDPIGKIVDGKEIIGVVGDFNQSAYELTKPLNFRLEPEAGTTIMVRIQPGHEKETVAAVEQFYKAYNPGYVFSYGFLGDRYNAQYAGERKAGMLSEYFAGLAIVISCLGLFGLAVFMAERRSKEIGIRKILGSSELQIVALMSRDFTRMIFVSIIIGLPTSYLLTSHWLERFAYKIGITWWYFAVPAAIVFLLTWITVGTQTIRAARVNPVNSLKSE
ncbi:MAG TPA: ABC transporter permease [Cyclobacteriaceae bacterium]